MKKYQLDEDPRNPVPIVEEEEDKQERGDHPNSIWVEEIVRLFGETHYTEKYSLMSRNKLKRLKLCPQNSTIPSTKTSSTKIQFRLVCAFRD